MTIGELEKRISDFEGSPDEWLKFEEEIQREIKENFSEEEIEEIMFLNILEPLVMICDGIKFEREKNNVR